MILQIIGVVFAVIVVNYLCDEWEKHNSRTRRIEEDLKNLNEKDNWIKWDYHQIEEQDTDLEEEEKNRRKKGSKKRQKEENDSKKNSV